MISFINNFIQVEDIFNESDESSSEDCRMRGDDLDDEENPPEARLLGLDDSSQETRMARDTGDSTDSETNIGILST